MKTILAFAFLLLGVMAFSGTVSFSDNCKSAVQLSDQDIGLGFAQADLTITTPDLLVCYQYETVPEIGIMPVAQLSEGYPLDVEHIPYSESYLRLNNYFNFEMSITGTTNTVNASDAKLPDKIPLISEPRQRCDVTHAALPALRAKADRTNSFYIENIATSLNMGTLHSWYDID